MSSDFDPLVTRAWSRVTNTWMYEAFTEGARAGWWYLTLQDDAVLFSEVFIYWGRDNWPCYYYDPAIVGDAVQASR